MIGNNDPVGTDLGSLSGIVRIEDSLQHQRERGQRADPFHISPRQHRALSRTPAPQANVPIMEMWGRKLWRKLEPGARLAPTITQGGRVNGDAQRLGTTGRNARDEITVEAAIALPIEQKPDGRGTCGHTFLNARRTRGAVDEH